MLSSESSPLRTRKIAMESEQRCSATATAIELGVAALQIWGNLELGHSSFPLPPPKRRAPL
jgi:hypothetical protein